MWAAEGEVEVQGRMPWSSNGTFLARLTEGGNAMLAVYKPGKGERPLWDFPRGLYRREAAAWNLSELLGWKLVPETIVRDGPLGEGSMQRFVPADFEQHYFTIYEDAASHPALRRRCAFDPLANTPARNSAHCPPDRERHRWGPDTATGRTVLAHQEYWQGWGRWSIPSWVLTFVVEVDGRIRGIQTLEGEDFPMLRTVDSASWLVPEVRGMGVGKAMRAAVLALAFGPLEAQCAITSAWEDNHASLGVSRSIGYQPNGQHRHRRDDGDGVGGLVQRGPAGGKSRRKGGRGGGIPGGRNRCAPRLRAQEVVCLFLENCRRIRGCDWLWLDLGKNQF